MPSIPSSSPPMKNPVTCSRPSPSMTLLLNTSLRQPQLAQVAGRAGELELAGADRRRLGVVHEDHFGGALEDGGLGHGGSLRQWAVCMRAASASRTRSNSVLLSENSRAPSRSARRRYGSLGKLESMYTSVCGAASWIARSTSNPVPCAS